MTDVLKPGHVVGELTLLDSGPRTETAAARTDAVRLMPVRRALRRFLPGHPEAAAEVLAALALGRRARDVDEKLTPPADITVSCLGRLLVGPRPVYSLRRDDRARR